MDRRSDGLIVVWSGKRSYAVRDILHRTSRADAVRPADYVWDEDEDDEPLPRL